MSYTCIRNNNARSNSSQNVNSHWCGGSVGRYASNSSRRRSVVGSHLVKPASFCRNTTSVPCTARTFKSVLCSKTMQQTWSNTFHLHYKEALYQMYAPLLLPLPSGKQVLALITTTYADSTTKAIHSPAQWLSSFELNTASVVTCCINNLHIKISFL